MLDAPPVFPELKNSYRIVVPVFLVLWVAVGVLIEKVFFAWVRRLASKTKSEIDDILIEAANKPILLLLIVTGLTLVFQFLLPDSIARRTTPFLPLSLKVLTVFSIALFIDKLALGSFRSYSVRYEFLKISSGLLHGITHVIVFSLAGLIALDSLGISITPIIASLGIGSLAVALALQPTLENLFAGFQIVFDQPVKPGQFIKLESGEEGYVQKVGWRSTWIYQPTNNTIIIPNSHLANSRILNYYYPSTEMALVVDLGVHYASDLEKVERVTTEVAEEIMKRSVGGVPDFKPLIRFSKLDSFSLNFSVIMRVKEFGDGGLIRHEFIKAIVSRYAREGIIIPYPVTAINTHQEKSPVLSESSN